MRVPVLVVSIFLFCTPAYAQATGNDLLNDCEQFLKSMKLQGGQVYSDPSPESMACWGFMNAAREFTFYGPPGAGPGVLETCLPSESILDQTHPCRCQVRPAASRGSSRTTSSLRARCSAEGISLSGPVMGIPLG